MTERYATATGDLPERVATARVAVGGRGKLAGILGVTGGAAWRFEANRIHPEEVAPLTASLEALEVRIAQGEFTKPLDRLSVVLAGVAEAIRLVEEVNRINQSKRVGAILPELLDLLVDLRK